MSRKSYTQQLQALRDEYQREERCTADHVGHIVCGCHPSLQRMKELSSEINLILDNHPRLDHRPYHRRPLQGQEAI
jgi:hypothetical protein